MPFPITPQDAQNCIASPSGTLCDNFTATLLKLPVLFYKFVSFMLDTSGNLSASFMRLIYKPGMVIQSAAPASEDANWLLCDGREVAQSAYPSLFAAIGNTYGTPTNAANFLLPDFRGRFPRGCGVMSYSTTDPDGNQTSRSVTVSLAEKGGEQLHFLTAEEGAMDRNHYHTTGRFISSSGANSDNWCEVVGKVSGIQAGDAVSVHGFGGTSDTPFVNKTTDDLAGEYAFTHLVDNPKDYNWVTKANHGFDGHNTVPPFLGVYFYIKT